MRKAIAIDSYTINEFGKRYIARIYKYRGHQYTVIINLESGSSTRDQHKACQQEIDDLIRLN